MEKKSKKSSPLFMLYDLQPAKYATCSVLTELELAAALDVVRPCMQVSNQITNCDFRWSVMTCRIAYQYVKFYHSQRFFFSYSLFLLLTGLFFQLLLKLQLTLLLISYFAVLVSVTVNWRNTAECWCHQWIIAASEALRLDPTVELDRWSAVSWPLAAPLVIFKNYSKE